MLHPRFQSQEYRIFRLWTFVITGLSGFAPVFHAMTLFPHDQLVKHMGVQWYYLEGVFILTGALIYGVSFDAPPGDARDTATRERYHVLMRDPGALPREMESRQVRHLRRLASDLPHLRRAGRRVALLRHPLGVRVHV